MNPNTTIGDYVELLNLRAEAASELWQTGKFEEAVRVGLEIEKAQRLFRGGCFSMAHQILVETVQ